jgi:hypothetical protein
MDSFDFSRDAVTLHLRRAARVLVAQAVLD